MQIGADAGRQPREGRFTLDLVDQKAPGQLLMCHKVTVEIDGEDKPALTAVWLTMLFV